MATHYIENGDSGNQYYFDPNSQASRPAQDRAYPVSVTTASAVGPSEYSPYPAGVSAVRPGQQQSSPATRAERGGYNENEMQQWPQQHQSVAGFNKTVSQQQYQSTSAAPAPQVRATVRTATNQDQQQQQQQQQYVSSSQYQQQQQRSPQGYANYEPAVSPPHQQVTGTSYHQPSPHDFDQRTDSPSRGREAHVQAQQVSVRSMSSSSHQGQESNAAYPQPQASPQQQQDPLQQYYSQLTPEQYQQLIRQQQIQRQQQDEQKRQQIAQQQYYLQQQERQRAEAQAAARSNPEVQNYDEYQRRVVVQQSSSNQEQYDPYQQRSAQVQSPANQDPYRQAQQLDAYYEQQRRAAAQQPSPSSSYPQDPYRPSPAGGQGYQQASPNQQRTRTDSERQRQDEQDYYAAQLVRQQQQEHAAQVEAAQRQRAQQQEPQIISAEQPTKPVGIKGLMNKFTGPTKIPTYESKSKISHSSQHTTSSGPGQSTTVTQSSQYHSMTYSALPKAQEPPVNSAAYFEMLQQGNNNQGSSYTAPVAAPPHIQGPAPGFGALRDRFKSGATSEGNTGSQEPRRGQTGNSSLSSLRDQFLSRATESTQGQDESFSQRIQTVSRTIVGEEPRPAKHVEEAPVQSQSVDEQGVSSEGALADGGSSSGASSLENDSAQNPTGST